MDTIFIRALKTDAVIGIYDWERTVRQDIYFDVEMDFDIRKAAASDHIGDTLDYKAVSKRLIDYVDSSQFFLVETLAERCARIIITEFSCSRVKLVVNKKGAVSAASDVGLIIERTTADYQ